MDTRIEQIRRNLVAASESLSRVYPQAPAQLRHEVNQAWERYAALANQKDMSAPAPGKNFGLLPLVIAGVVGLSAIIGGTAYITHELKESEVLKKISECVEDATKRGISLPVAQETCNKLYRGEKVPLLEVGGLNLTPLVLLGGIGIIALVLLKK